MQAGKRLHGPETLVASRSRASSQLARLPQRLRSLATADTAYRVEIAPALRHLAARVDSMTPELPALLR
jgi:hypothetical protein